MLAALRNITIEQGSVFCEGFTWLDSDGNLKNLNGYTAKAEVRENYDDEDAAATFNVTIIGGIGLITICLNAQQTKELNFTKGIWSLEVSPSGAADLDLATDTIRLVEGTVTISLESTK